MKEIMFGYNSWKPLARGDTICLIAPSYGFETQKELSTALKFIREHLAQWGLYTQWNDKALKDKDPLCPEKAMKTATATLDIKQAFRDPKIKAIWALLGGRLSHEMWELLDKEPQHFPPKPLIGCS